MEVHTQLRNALSNREREKDKINPSIHATPIIISVLKEKFGNQMRASDVDQRITRSQIFRKRKNTEKKFHFKKSLKLMCTD